MKNILLLNGPNLGMLGKREPEFYGDDTLEQIVSRCQSLAKANDLGFEARQSNHEGQLVDWLNEAFGKIGGLIINPGGLTHSSVTLRDAVAMHRVPIIEVHLSNIHARESFRSVSLIAGIATGSIVGLGAKGYELAVLKMADILK